MKEIDAQESQWVHQLAESERQRIGTTSSFKSAIQPYMASLTAQIRRDLLAYYAEFPEEEEHIEEHHTEDGTTIIRKSAPASERFVGITHSVEFAFEITSMVLICKFTHAPQLNKEFPLMLKSDGEVSAGITIQDLSKYLLAPVLFSTIPAAELQRPSE